MSSRPRLSWRRLGLLVPFVLPWLASSVRAGDADQYLPTDSIIVIKINVRQLLDSQLARDYWAPGLRWQYEQNNDQMQAFFKDVGFDLFKDLDRMILTGPGDNAPRMGLAILRGRFDLAKIDAKMDHLSKSQPDTVKVLRAADGKGVDCRMYQVYPGKPGSTYIALPDANTLFSSDDKDIVVEALKKVGAQAKTSLKDKDLQAVLENLDDKQVLSVAAVGGVLERFTFRQGRVLLLPSIQRVAAFSAGVALGENIKCNVAVRTKTATEARVLYATANTSARLVMLAVALKNDDDNPLQVLVWDIVRGIKVRSKDRTVLFGGRLNVEEAEQLLQKAGLDIVKLKEAFKKAADR